MGQLNNANCSLSRGSFVGVQNLAAATLCCWVRMDAEANDCIFSVGTNTLGTEMRIGVNRDGALEFKNESDAPDGTTEDCVSALGIPTVGTYYHFGVVTNVAGDVMQTWVNGVLSSQCAIAFGPTAFNNSACGGAALGSDPIGDSNESAMWGEDYRIYNRALTAAEFETIFNCRGHDNIKQGLLNRWTVREGAPGVAITVANSVKDLGLSQNHMSPNVGSGGPQWDISRISARRRFM